MENNDNNYIYRQSVMYPHVTLNDSYIPTHLILITVVVPSLDWYLNSTE